MTPGFELPVGPCHGEPCRRYGPGHRMHHIHARRIAESPWGWRDGLVTAVRRHVVQVAYFDGTATPLAWHHAELTEVLRPGDPVRLHERYHALGCPLGWFNIVIAGGLGPVTDPDDPAAWRDQVTAAVVDCSTGTGLALDHVDPMGW